MRLNEIRYTDAKPIDGYGPGFFRVGGEVVQGAVLVSHIGTGAWGGFDDTASILRMAQDIDVLFVGTGAEIAHVPPAFQAAMDQAGVGVEPMASPTACRTYNVLLSEGRRVAAALIPV